MEELRSTEVLERDIYAEARKRADHILSCARADCAQLEAHASARVQDITRAVEQLFAQRIAAYERNAQAVIPLERIRQTIRAVDTRVQRALASYFEKIGEEKRLRVLARLLERYAPLIGEQKITVRFFGYCESRVRDLLNQALPRAVLRSLTPFDKAEAWRAQCSDGLTIETEDGTLQCRGTIEEICAQLLSEKRQELACALCGNGVVA
ncbi:hypothetical protein TPCCA_0530 [Treponema paraluiscuniculi Cuniculi A]|uniref:V-type ATP synthase subunit E n=2 Tax=Treponema paraluiscuniculi TaxID=53435 RepID=F7XSX9_TREPU|nr:ATPase [Treponema paraluiscuniculi]AEH40468.1 hypothetical protein TPCCA_0530 [Treponema paraluiscuniculi Cuniculi A]WKC72396.1 hypothetical protein TPLL2_0530 [Treponema paraluiscuniculi]